MSLFKDFPINDIKGDYMWNGHLSINSTTTLKIPRITTPQFTTSCSVTADRFNVTSPFLFYRVIVPQQDM